MSYSFLFTCKGYSVDVGAWESSVSLWGHLEPIKSPQRQQCGWTLNQRASSNDGVYGLCGLYSTQDLLFQQNRFVITLRNSFYNYFHEISVPSLIIVHINCKDISCLCLWEEWFIGTHCVLFLALEYSCGLHLGRVGWWLYVSWKRSKCGKRAVTKALLPCWGGCDKWCPNQGPLSFLHMLGGVYGMDKSHVACPSVALQGLGDSSWVHLASFQTQQKMSKNRSFRTTQALNESWLLLGLLFWRNDHLFQFRGREFVCAFFPLPQVWM